MDKNVKGKPYFYLQNAIRKKLMATKTKLNKELLPYEIEENSKPALSILDMAYREIDEEERNHPN